MLRKKSVSSLKYFSVYICLLLYAVTCWAPYRGFYKYLHSLPSARMTNLPLPAALLPDAARTAFKILEFCDSIVWNLWCILWILSLCNSSHTFFAFRKEIILSLEQLIAVACSLISNSGHRNSEQHLLNLVLYLDPSEVKWINPLPVAQFFKNFKIYIWCLQMCILR